MVKTYKKTYKKYPKANGYKKAMGYAGMAYKAYTMAKYIKGLVNVEKKVYDISTTGNVPQTLTFANLSLMSQGDTYATRDGNSIRAKSLLVRLLLDQNANAISTNVRFILLRDTQQANVTPVGGDVLEIATSPVNLVSPLAHTNGGRFQILIDKEFALSTNGKRQWMFDKYIRMSDHIKYDGTIPREGALFWAICSNEGTNFPTYNLFTRLRFIDN